MTKPRTKAQYDAVFEDLMRYTSFSSAAEIRTDQDLRKFFEQVNAHAIKNRKSKLPVFPSIHDPTGHHKDPFRNAMIKSAARTGHKAQPATNPAITTLERKKAYKSYQEAKEARALIPVLRYKDAKGRTIVENKKAYYDGRRWRGEDGRFTNTPDKYLYFGGQKAQ